MAFPVAAAAAGLQFLGNMMQSHGNSEASRYNTDRTIHAQYKLAEYAYQKQMEMWHMQNQYNSPAEQMKRFGAAGLNPHLIYGQGNPGNAQSVPQYQAPNVQYRYAAPQMGAAISSVIPTLMSVGTWMQNMKLAEVEIEAKKSNVEKAQQLIQYLEQRNPREIQKLDNVLSLYPYQKSMLQANEQTAWTSWNQLLHEGRFKYGEDGKTGVRGLQLLQEEAKSKIERAKASWTDFNVTNPQSLIQLVLSGVMGMAGQQLRLSTHRSASPKRIKTFYQGGKRRSQVVDYD